MPLSMLIWMHFLKQLTHLRIKFMSQSDDENLPIGWPEPEQEWDVDESMKRQIEIQKNIEAYEKIDEDIKNGIIPF